MLVIELNKDIVLLGREGTMFIAKFVDDERLVIVSNGKETGRIIHSSEVRVIGEVITPEDRIIDGIVKIHERWEDEPHDGVAFEADVRDLATRIYRYVKDELEQENQKSG